MDADEIQRRWNAMMRNYWDQGPSVCGGCGAEFTTGSVVLIFGDLDNTAARHLYACEQCAFDRMRHGPTTPEKESGSVLPRWPGASIVYVQKPHRVRVFAQLLPTVRKRILEADEIISRVNAGLREFIEQFGGEVVRDDEKDGVPEEFPIGSLEGARPNPRADLDALIRAAAARTPKP